MSLKMKPYVHIAPVTGGVYFGGPTSQFVLGGWDKLYTVADACAPLLQDGTTEDDLVAALGTERARPVVQRIIAGLSDHHMLMPLERQSVTAPEPGLRARHSASLTYLESAVDDPYAVFARVRRATVALCGPAVVVDPLATSLERAGFGAVLVVSDLDVPVVADALVWVTDEVAGARAVAGAVVGPTGLPVPVVPVLVGDSALIAGPVVSDTLDVEDVVGAWQRALHWIAAEDTGAVARPVGDVLVGALAGHLVFDAVVGLGTPTMQVVFGERLTTRVVEVDDAPPAETGIRRLDACVSVPLGTAGALVGSSVAISRNWSGLFARATGEELLPQMPIAVREVDLRAGQVDSPVSAWAPDQEWATLTVSVDALREAPDGRRVAAGLTEERWLLDGALRHLVGEVGPEREVALADLGGEPHRLLRALLALEPADYRIGEARLPGLDWRLLTLRRAGSAEVVAVAWGEDLDSAGTEVLGSAVHLAQLRDLGVSAHVTSPRTGRLVYGPEGAVAALRAQVEAYAATTGRVVQGHPDLHDPVLGDLPLWRGTVELVELVELGTVAAHPTHDTLPEGQDPS